MKRRLCVDKVGVSLVVATMILVAVTITVSVAISFWLSGLAGSYTRFEKIEVVSAYAVRDESMGGSGWSVKFIIRNTGSADATIDNILINSKPLADYSGRVLARLGDSQTTTVNVLIGAGGQVTIELYIMEDEHFTTGVCIEVCLHSASGQEYPRIIALP